jgi:hypothetical protein
MTREQLAADAMADGAWMQVTAVKPKLIEPKPAASHAPWIHPIAEYERRETTIVEGPRYG